MDKVYKIASQESGTSAAVKETDWEKCIVCQQITSEVLKCPADSKRSIDGAGYKTLTENLLVQEDRLLVFKQVSLVNGRPRH